MPLAVGKAHHFVFDGRTVARPDPQNLSAEKRRAVNVVADDPMRFGIRVYDVAGYERAIDGGIVV